MGVEQTVAERLMTRAVADTGLDDFGENSFRTGLEILVRSNLDGEPPLALMAEIEEAYVAALTNRLRLTNYVKTHPELKATPVARPLFIFGMPRSGTSLVSYLIGQDQARRSLLLWEAWESVPPPTTATLRTDPRCLARLAAQQREFAKSPDEVRPHVEFPDGPTECLRLHGQEFKAVSWELYMPVKEYSRWLMQTDMTSAYTYQKAALQVLQTQAPGPWALKMPSHALHIEALYGVFPDARLVWVHRDPHKALASLFSKKSRAWKRTTGDPHLEWLREHYTVQMAEHLNRPLRLRQRIGPERIYDLHYADMIGDPFAALRALYSWLGDDFTSEAESAMKSWLEQNPQNRFGKHSYMLEEFGLSERALRPYFSNYFDVFTVEREE